MQTIDPIAIALIVVSGLALAVMAGVVARAARRGAPHARLCALGLAVGGVALGGALLALALGAARYDTGRFLVGMSVGVTLGLSLGSAIILAANRRAARADGLRGVRTPSRRL